MDLQNDKWVGDFHPCEREPGGVLPAANYAKTKTPYDDQRRDQDALETGIRNGIAVSFAPRCRHFSNGKMVMV